MGRITAAPIPVSFILENGEEKEYYISPMSDKDIDEIDEWVQSQILHVARKSLPANATPAEREETLTLAIREASRAGMAQPGNRAFYSIRGITHVAWISLRKKHSDIQESFVRELFSNPLNLGMFNSAFTRANSLEGLDIPATDGEPESKKVEEDMTK